MKTSLALSALSALIIPAALRAADVDLAALSEAEWKEYRFEQVSVESANPDLVAESNQIKEEKKRQEQALEAAMTAADPSLAPLLTKRAALLTGNWWAPAEADTLTAADWQKIRDARAAARAANPDFVAAGKVLKEKIQAYEAKIDAALIKVDPGLADLVNAIRKRRAD
jgi:hypothetical protein